MGKYAGIHIFKVTIADIPGFRSHQFLCHAGPNHEGTRYFLFFHHLLHGYGCIDNDSLTRIMPFAMPGCTINNG